MLKLIALAVVVIAGLVLLHAAAKLVLWVAFAAALLYIGHAMYRRLADR